MKQSLGHTPTALRVFFACLLTFNIFIAPIGAMAASVRQGSGVRGQGPTKQESGVRGQGSANSANDVFAKPLEAKTGSSLPSALPEPAPQPLAPPPAVSDVAATLTATLVPGAGGDVDSDGKADPGDTINYSITLTSSGAGATGLSLSNPLDSHTTLVGGTLNSTPVAFDLTQPPFNEDSSAVTIALSAQDPDGVSANPGSNLTFSIVNAPTKGTLGSIGAPSCNAAGVCTANVDYTPTANLNGSDSFTFKVNDGISDSNQTGTVSITINSVNDAPTFTAPGNPAATNEDAGAITVTNFIGASIRPAQPGNTTEDSQTVSFEIVSNSNTSLFSSAPALNVNAGSYPKTANLTYTAAANQNGTATITYHLKDNGCPGSPGIPCPNGGVDTSSPDQTFTITVNPVNDPPVVVAPAAYSAMANMKVTGLTGLLGVGGNNVTDVDTGTGSPPCNPTPFTVKSGSISATTPAGGIVSNVNLSTGSFDFEPPPGVTGDVTFTYIVSDNGCPGVADSAPVTVHVTVSGPVIWFVSPGAGPDTTHTGTLNNPFQLLASANTAMGVNAGQRIFVSTGTTTSGVGVTLTTSQWLIGQGATDSGGTTNFDTLMGITPPANTIARPAVNGTKPTIQGRVQMNASNTRVQGVAIAPPAGTQGLTGTSGAAMTGMQVGISATQSDVTVTTLGQSGTNAMGVSLNNAGGVFSFISINVNKDVSNNQPNKGISLTNTTGSFTVLGVGTTAGSGGTIQNVTARGLETNGAQNVTLKNMNFTNANTVNGADPTVTPSTCGDIASSTDDNTGCNASIYLQTVTGVTITNVVVDTAAQMGINGNGVTNFSLTNSTVKNAGNQVKESGVNIKNLNGTNTFTNDALFNDNKWPLRVQNWTGTSTITIDTVTFTGLGIANVASTDGFLFGLSTGATSANITIQNSNFYNNHSFGTQLDTISGTITATITNNKFGRNGDGVAAGCGSALCPNSGGIALTTSNGGIIDYTISGGNSIYGSIVGIVTTESGSSTASSHLSGTISGNTIGNNAIADSGGAPNGYGIQINGQGAGTVSSNILNNSISQVQNTGINIETMTNSSKGIFHIKGNTINPSTTINNFGISIWAGNSSTGGPGGTPDNSNVCAEIGGPNPADKNTINGVWSSNVAIRARQRFSTTYNISGYNGGGTNFAALQTYIAGNNNITNGTQTVSASSTTAFVSTGATCAAVSPLLLAEGGVLAELNSPSLLSNFMLSLGTPNFDDALAGRCIVSASKPLAIGLEQKQLDSIVAAAIERWTTTGLTPQQVATLHRIKFDIADLSGAYLGEADGDRILVDRTAEGKGWFVDSHPLSDASFTRAISATRLYTTPTNAAAGHIDLLTAIMHEMGHKLGLDDSYAAKDRDSLMYGYLTVGERRLPSKDQAANATASNKVESHFLSLISEDQIRSLQSQAENLAAASSQQSNRSESFSLNMHVISGMSGESGVAAGVRGEKAKVRDQRLEVRRSNHASSAGAKGQATGVRSQESGVREAGFRGQGSGVRAHHARSNSTLKTENLKLTTAAPFVPTPVGQFPINGTGTGAGFTLPAGKTTTITFKATLNAPPNLSGVPPAAPKVSAQGTLSGAFIGNPIVTDDTSVGGTADPTVTNVDLYDSTTSVGASPDPPVAGQSVTYTATIGTSGTPNGSATNRTGSVNFTDGGVTSIPGCSSQTVTSNLATCTTTFANGPHSIIAFYSGDGNFDPSDNHLTPLGQTVNKSNTTTGVQSSKPSSLVSESVTFTATVTSNSTFTGPPTGSVDFYDGTFPGPPPLISGCGARPLNGSAVATCTTSALTSAGSPHTITAVYSGDTNFNTSSGAVSQTVTKSDTSVLLTTSANPVAPTVQVTYTATVSSAEPTVPGPPDGTVTFNDGGSPITCAAGSQALTAGVATCKFTYPDTSGSPHDITAVYNGDDSGGRYNGSTSNHISETVQSCSASFVVTDAGDSAVSGSNTLRDAINNQICDGGTITFNLGAGPHVINLTDANKELLINKNLTINGPGANLLTVQRDGAATTDFRVFNIDVNTTPPNTPFAVTISGMTISNGRFLADPMAPGSPGSSGTSVTGGGILNNGTLVLQDVTVSGNHITAGAGGNGAGSGDAGGSGGDANGGGIFNVGTLTLTNSTVSSNTATAGAGGDSTAGVAGSGGSARGGGVYSITGALTITNSTISSNTTTPGAAGGGTPTTPGTSGGSKGGGVYSTDASLKTISGSTFDTNHAIGAGAEGGGIDNEGGTLSITNSTISGNISDGIGGGLLNCGTSTGTLTSVTITGNRSDFDNSGSEPGAGIGQVSSNTIKLRNTIVAGNFIGSTGGLQTETATVVGTITTSGNAKAVVTFSGAPSGETVLAAVSSGDDASAVAGKMRAALVLDSTINNFFTVSGTGPDIVLTVRTAAANDPTPLNIATDNDDSVGLTPQPTSVHTLAGAPGSEIFVDLSSTLDTANSTFNLISDAASSGGLTDGSGNNIVGVGGTQTRNILTILNTTLANNGGPTKTHALVDNSPALDNGDDFSGPPTTDQRGFLRPVDIVPGTGPGDESDIGAFERQSPVPTIAKAFNPTAIPSGGTSTVTLTLTNPNSFDLTNASFTDALANMSAVGGPASGTCAGAASNTVTAGDGSKSFSGITIPAFSSCTVMFDVTSSTIGVNPNATSGVTTNEESIGPASNTANLTVFATGISKAFSPAAIQSGGTSTIVITLTNSNVAQATNASFTDNLVNMSAVGGPAAGTCAGASSNTVTAGSGTKSFSGITIPGSGSGGTCTVTFDVTSTNLGDNPNSTSGVTTDQTPLSAGSSPVSLTVYGPPTIGKSFGPATIGTGGTSTVTLTLTNPNVADLTNASFTDNLVNMGAVGGPAGGTCAGASSNTVSAGSGLKSFTGITIPGTGTTGSCTVTFVVTSSTLGTNPNATSGVTTTQTSIAGNPSNTDNLTVVAPPTVSSITRVDADPTSASSVHFLVTFSRSVTGVNIGANSDFALSTTGISGASVTGLSGSGAVYTVTVDTGSGDGTLGLNVVDDDSILSDDAAALPLGGTGAGNGNFNTGQVYTVDRSNPSVVSITLAGSSPTNATSVQFTVTFSESVSPVAISDFALTTTGVAGSPAVTNVSGSGKTYTVTASTGTGNGTIRLDLNDSDGSIKDQVGKTLTGPGGPGNGAFTGGEVYTIDKTPPDVTINQAGTQTDPVTGPTAGTVIHFTAVFTEPVSDFTNGDVSITGTANASVVNVNQIAPNDGKTYDVAVEGMTQSGTVIASIASGVAHDSAGNGNTTGTFTDHTVTYFVDNFTTFEVNSTADTDDGHCDALGTGSGNKDCTLREAINAANADAGAETITFNIPNSDPGFSGGVYTITLLTALPDITDDVTIQGLGANVLTIKRDSANVNRFRIFTINSGKTVNISGVTITGGRTADNAGVPGGGISNLGTLNLTGVAVSGNRTGDGAVAAGSGGGIISNGTLTVTNSTISGNQTGAGTAPGSTGGIGGGIDGNGTLTVTNSTISGNQTGAGSSGSDGGGICLIGGSTLTLVGSTITGNSTGGTGGGGGIMTNGGTVTIKNTIIGGNTAPGGSGPDINGTVNSEGYNLIQSTSGATINETLNAGTNITGANPGLNPLADNGGPTKTHSLLCTSPAIDKGKAFGLTTDQRGGTRPFDFADAIFPNAVGGDGSDIGAFETQAGGGCVPEAQSPNPQPTTNEDTSVSVQLKAVYSQNVQMTFSIDTAPANGSLGAITGTTCTFNLSTTCTANVLYTPNPDYFGLDTFKFTASTNPGGLTSDPADVNVTINSVNDPPSFFLGPNQNVLEDAGPQTVANFANTISVGPSNEAGQTYSFILQTNTNASLFSAAPALDTAGTLTYTPAANANGSATITFIMKDSGGTANGGNDTSVPRTFTINVASVNDPPTFTKGPDVVVNENAPTQTINNWATAISPGPPDESGQTVEFKVTNFTNPGLFSLGPLLNSNGTLTFKPTPNTSGSSVVTIVLKDNGGTANGGIDTSPPQTFTITVGEGGSLQFSSATYSVGESGGNAAITITRTGGSAGATSVQFATSNGTATAGSDYTAVSQTVTFNDGETSKIVNIPITDDLINEPNETVNLTLSNVTGSGELGTPATAVLTINDNDPVGGYIKFSSANYSVAEGGVATITVQRIGTLTQSVTVDYATSDSSAGPQASCAPTPGNTLASSRCDYTSAFGQITFGAGDGADKTFSVLIDQDSYVEGPETFTLTLSNPTGGANLVTPSTSTLTINDDVSEPGFNLADDTNTFVEQLYRDFLNRPSDPAGKSFWVDNIDKCNDPARRLPGLTQAQCIEVQRINTAAAFFLSIEFQTTGGTAYLTNKAAFGTVPTFLNFETDAQAIGRGYVFGQPGAEAVLEANKVAYFNAFVARSSFTAIYGGLTNAQYVDTLIANTGVSFTPAERNALVNGLNSATETRATVLRKITEKASFRDAEFNRIFVLMEYFGFLRRDPDAAGFNFWLTKLNQFNGNYINAEMIKAFINSLEYRGRFGP